MGVGRSAEQPAQHQRHHQRETQRGACRDERAVEPLECGLARLRPSRARHATGSARRAPRRPPAGWRLSSAPVAASSDASSGKLVVADLRVGVGTEPRLVGRRRAPARRRRSAKRRSDAALSALLMNPDAPARRPRGALRSQNTPPRPGSASSRGRCMPQCAQLTIGWGAGGARRLRRARGRRRGGAGCRAAATAARNTAIRNSMNFMRCTPSCRRALQQHLEHEARTHVGEQQQRRTGVEPARRAAGPRQPNACRPASSPAKTTQPSTENTVLWSQRQGSANQASPAPGWPTAPRSPRRRTGTSAAPAAAAACRARRADRPAFTAHPALGAVEHHRVQHRGAEQAVGGDAQHPVQRRPARIDLRPRLAGEGPGQRDDRRRPAAPARGARSAAARSGSRRA